MRALTASLVMMVLACGKAAAAGDRTMLSIVATLIAADGQCRSEGYQVELRRAMDVAATNVTEAEIARDLPLVYGREMDKAMSMPRADYCADVARRLPAWVYR